MGKRIFLTAALLGTLTCISLPSPAEGYIGGPPLTLGHMCAWSTHVMIARIDRIDDNKTVLVFRKVRDVKGKWPADTFRQFFPANFANRGHIFDWVEPGKIVVVCALESYKWCHVYVDKEWYAAVTSDWVSWNVSHSEPLLLRMYAGRPDRLADAVVGICAGREVIVPGMIDSPLDVLQKRQAKLQRIVASMKRLDYNPRRDFVNFGHDDFTPLAGMPGFTHATTLRGVGTDAFSIVCADFDGDGKQDVLLVGSHRISMQLNGGEYFNEVYLPGLEGPIRGAVAADYNGDGRSDLLVATAAGPRLYTNLGQGTFRDDSALLPGGGVQALTAAAWIDYDGDGKPDILVANGYHGLRLYRNRGLYVAKETIELVKDPKNPGRFLAPVLWFEDVSDQVGLGPDGPGAGMKGETLTVCDVNGDGRPDFLFGAGSGMLFLNRPGGFDFVPDSGISFTPGKVGPVFGDFNGDGIPDLFVPQNGKCKLFRGDGKGRFVDVSARSGALAEPIPWATCAAWGDVDNDGHLDLVIGCLRGPNRCFRNKGDGTFAEFSEELGLNRKIYNTQAVCLADLNGDGMLDMIFNNENQEGVVLLGNSNLYNKRIPVTFIVAGSEGVTGSQVQVFDLKGRRLAGQEISGGDGRNQPPAEARFALDPGTYRVRVRFSSGVTRGQEITVVRNPVRLKVDGQTPVLVP